ncbi:hypothetical protein glysoja_047449 [Glycine soja]|uniref:Uncharacterized protein n=1 Tax=Glycine soja TaxID=3848 RepID=A0A0B2S4V9_GLYSO|nr:hypothetical protein glysoja_047449 [Glycine soja]
MTTFQNTPPPSSPNLSKPPLSRRSKRNSNPSTTSSRKSLLSSLGFRAGIGIAIEVKDEAGAEKNVGKGAEAVIDTGKCEGEAGVEGDIRIVKERDGKLGYFP